MDDLDTGRIDQARGVARDERDVGAALGHHAGHRVALLARAAVSDESHRVDRLAGAAGGDQHLDAGQVVRQRVAAVQQQLGERGDLLGLGQAAGAAVGAGQAAGRGFENDCAAAAQRRDVVDGRRVKPHLGVHRRREQHGTSRGQQRRGQQVVGTARDRAGQQVSGGRRDDDEIGFLADADVRHLVDVIPDAGVHGVSGQRLEGGGADEAQRGIGGDDADGVAGLGELTDDGGRLVGGDATGDADDDPLALRISRQALVTRPRCARAGLRGSRAARSTAAFPAGRARPAGRRTRGCRRRAGCSSR